MNKEKSKSPSKCTGKPTGGERCKETASCSRFQIEPPVNGFMPIDYKAIDKKEGCSFKLDM